MKRSGRWREEWHPGGILIWTCAPSVKAVEALLRNAERLILRAQELNKLDHLADRGDLV